MTFESCCVSNNDCLCPANLENLCLEGANLRTKCFACGLPVCKNCSKIIKWFWFGRRRICESCIEGVKDEKE